MSEIPNDVELTILRRYAAGGEMPKIAAELNLELEAVAAAVSQLAGFQRGRARELVRQYEAAHQSPPSPKPTPPPVAPAIRPPVPTKPASELEPAPDGATEVGVPTAVPPARVPEVVITPRTDVSRSPVEAVLARAVVAGGRYAKRAGKIREQITELDGEMAEYQRVADAERRVEELRAELAKAAENLRAVRGRPGPTKAAERGARSASAREIRAWALTAGVPCSPLGIVPAAVVQAYQDAHAEVSGG